MKADRRQTGHPRSESLSGKQQRRRRRRGRKEEEGDEESNGFSSSQFTSLARLHFPSPSVRDLDSRSLLIRTASRLSRARPLPTLLSSPTSLFVRPSVRHCLCRRALRPRRGRGRSPRRGPRVIRRSESRFRRSRGEC